MTQSCKAATRRSRLRFGIGIAIYGATVALSFVSAVLTLVVHFAIAVYYVGDQLAVGDDADAEPAADMEG